MSHKIVALWSHPRSVSTAFERIMRARGDMQCLHEPFMYDYYIHRSKRDMPHFQAKDEHPKTYDAIRDMILKLAETGPVFFKDMSYYVMPHIFADTEFLDRITHSFLLRDPVASIVSYAKLDPDVTLEEIGIEAQWRQAEALMARNGKPPIVVQSEKLQSDPRQQMQSYWKAVGLTDSPAALDWKDEAPQDWQQVSGWHQDVMTSKTIRPLAEDHAKEMQQKFIALVAQTPRMKAYLDYQAPFHEKLLRYAL